MAVVARKPWVGLNYDGLLIIGESHYGGPPGADEDFTVDVVKQVVAGTVRHRLFTEVACVVTGKPSQEVDRAAFWNGVAFWNFVQRSMHNRPERPRNEDWSAGRDLFIPVASSLVPQPHHILVLGTGKADAKSTYENMPQFDLPDLPSITVDERDGWPGYYRMAEGKYALTMAISHPRSRGWSWKAWHPLVEAFLAMPNQPGDD